MPLTLAACGGNPSSPDGGGPDGGSDVVVNDAPVDVANDADATAVDAGPFVDGGLATVNLSLSTATFQATAIESDGKIVAAGGADDAFVVARFLATGVLDSTFGAGGMVVTPFGGAMPRFQPSQMSVLVQPDNKVVVVSSYRRLGAFNADSGIVLRYAADGTLDTTFATSGYVVDATSWYAGALQTNGGIVTGGLSPSVTGELARYTPAGALDPTFGTAGYAGAGSSAPYGITLQANGSIVTVDSKGIARYSPAGAADTTFGVAGRASSPGALRAAAIQNDGSFVVGGRSGAHWAIGRYGATGTLDSTFGTSGFAIDDGGAALDEDAYGVAIQSDGKIVSCGVGKWAGVVGTSARHTSSGVLDTSFASSGIVPLGNFLAPTYAIALQGDGKLVAAGFGENNTGLGPRLSRFDTAGLADATFGTSGVVVSPFGGSFDRPSAVALAPDGKIVVAGQTGVSANLVFTGQAGVVRLDAAGHLDTSFGTNGVAMVSSLGYANGVAVQPNGAVLVAGGSVQALFQVVRLDPTGKLDATFGTSGVGGGAIGTDLGVNRAMAIAPGGKIVLAGVDESGAMTAAVMRLSADGARDAAFGANGAMTATLGGTNAEADAVAVQADGKIVIAGVVTASTTRQLAIARILDDGTLDATFGTSGVTLADLGTTVIPTALAIQSDGSFVVLGASRQNNTTTAASYLVRFTAAGALDASFGNAGVVVEPTLTTGGDGASSVAMGLAIQADGKILVGASTLATSDGLSEDATVFRYTTAGALDSTFASAGRWTLAQTPSGAHALLLQADGSLLVVARVWTTAGDSDFGVARIIP